jgi:hypothetical protein
VFRGTMCGLRGRACEGEGVVPVRVKGPSV